MREFLSILGHNLREFALTLDSALNVLLATLTIRRGYSDETMSAHCWRSYRDGKPFGRLFLPLIDFMFSWQKPDEEVNQAAKYVVDGHCHRAYWKEILRRGLPPEYR
jgi:hypothetical protein